MMTVQRASDAERGISSLLTTWAPPGLSLVRSLAARQPGDRVQGSRPRARAGRGERGRLRHLRTQRASTLSRRGGLYRPIDISIGHRARDADEFSWNRIAAGTFLIEQFIAPGVSLPDGRLVSHHLGIGRARRQLAVRRAPLGRRRPHAALPAGRLRTRSGDPQGPGGDGRLQRADPVLRPGRHPELGHPGPRPSGRHLRHQSALQRVPVLPRRVPRPWRDVVAPRADRPIRKPERWRTAWRSLVLSTRLRSLWSRHRGHAFCGMQMACSFDRGRTRSTDLLFDRAPDGEPFDNYYNAMNGTFVPSATRRRVRVRPLPSAAPRPATAPTPCTSAGTH